MIGPLDPRTGRRIARQRSRAGADELARFDQSLVDADPDADVIDVARDNGPVHFCDSLRSMIPAKVVPLRLPTYAPWTNPIEKSWRWLRQEVLHMHRYAADWGGLVAAVEAWLVRQNAPCPEMLRYTGLHP